MQLSKALSTVALVLLWCLLSLACPPPPASVDAGGSSPSDAGGPTLDAGVADAGVDVAPGWQLVAANEDWACAVDFAGRPTCWGRNNYGQADPPDEVSGLVQLSLGFRHACGVDSGGNAVCWGSDDDGRASPPGAASFTKVLVTGRFSCGLASDGHVQCWGHDVGDFFDDVSQQTYRDFAVAHRTFCGVTTEGVVQCHSSHPLAEAPPSVEGDGWTAIVGYQFDSEEEVGYATAEFSVLDDTGAVKRFTQLEVEPGFVHDGDPFISSLVGPLGGCGLRDNTTLYCWDAEPVDAAALPLISAAVSESVGCAITSARELLCNGHYESPARVGLLDAPVEEVAWGTDISCLMTTSGSIGCFGRFAPDGAPLEDGQSLMAMSGHAFHACGLVDGGAVRCWGQTAYAPDINPFEEDPGYDRVLATGRYTCLRREGVLACSGGSVETPPPMPMADGDRAHGTIKGFCLHRETGTVDCFGENLDEAAMEGELDAPAITFERMCVFLRVGCGLDDGGALTCWGDSDALTALPEGPFVDVACGGSGACVLDAAGKTTCFGNEDLAPVFAPQPTYAALFSGALGQCGLREDGTLDCWNEDFFTFRVNAQAVGSE